jgi:hypothetical protein
MSCRQISICGKQIHLYWSQLSLVIIPAILAPTFAFRNTNHQVYYVPFSVAVATYILFYNFPYLVTVMHKRPIYLDDLKTHKLTDENDNNYDFNFRRKYHLWFLRVNTVTSAVIIGLTSALWFFRAKLFGSDGSAVNFAAAVAVIGALFKVYYYATMLVGRIVMWVLKYLKEKEQKYNRRLEEQQLIEVINDARASIPDIEERKPQRSMSTGNLYHLAVEFNPKSTLMAPLFDEDDESLD